jgi:hypothetical protein
LTSTLSLKVPCHADGRTIAQASARRPGKPALFGLAQVARADSENLVDMPKKSAL